MSPEMELRDTHRALFELHAEILDDAKFRTLCEQHGLPWDPRNGYEPRWYNGPAPEDTRVLVFLAEPGAITPSERLHLLPAIAHAPWVGTHDLSAPEHYWRANLRELCSHIWPDETEAEMNRSVGASCTFWMSLPPGAQTRDVPADLVKFFNQTYLRRLIALFPSAVLIAAGGKAQRRLTAANVTFIGCSALTRPESNKPKARESWRRGGLAVAAKLAAMWPSSA